MYLCYYDDLVTFACCCADFRAITTRYITHKKKLLWRRRQVAFCPSESDVARNLISQYPLFSPTQTFRHSLSLNSETEYVLIKSGYRSIRSDYILREVYYMKRGHLHGTYICYHQNGKICFLAKFVDGSISESVEYTFTGGPLALKNYKNKKEHGESIIYDRDRNDNLNRIRVLNQEEGQYHGLSKIYNHLNELEKEHMYNKGTLEGPTIVYDRHGHYKVVYVKGVLEGPYEEWRKTIDNEYYLRVKATFKKYNLHGECVYYYDDGSVYMIATYNKGVLVGDIEVYNNDVRGVSGCPLFAQNDAPLKIGNFLPKNECKRGDIQFVHHMDTYKSFMSKQHNHEPPEINDCLDRKRQKN
jgi:antitoxin component YwqK of YwqJK toxin-antitoxin module